MVALVEIVLRLSITFIFSMLFGLERQRSHKPVGFGTFTFVAMGSCALAVSAISLPTDNFIPLLSAIVTGIGFLGAGALIKTSDKIFGFTTAASVWVFAIFGLLTGIGEYFVAISLYGLIWVIIIMDKRLENRGIGTYRKKIHITANRSVKQEEIWALLGNLEHKLIQISSDLKEKKHNHQILVEGPREIINSLPDLLQSKDWIEGYKIE